MARHGPTGETAMLMESRSRSIRSHVSRVVLGFLVAILAVDQLLSMFRLPRVYGSGNESRWKLELYEAQRKPPDVVFLGCSYEFFGINPRIVDAEVESHTGTAIRSLNLSSAGATCLTQTLLMRRILERGLPPRVVYLGLSPRSVEDSRRKWQIAGIRALGEARDARLILPEDLSLLGEAFRAAAFRSNHQIDDTSLIMRRLFVGAPLMPAAKAQYDDRGWARWLGGDRKRFRNNEDGGAGQFPVGNGGAFDRPNVNGRALRWAIAALQSKGVSVRLLEMPLPSTASTRDDRVSRGAYRRFVDALGAAAGLAVLRPPRDVVADRDFFDDGHLSAQGAEKFSRWLAKDVARLISASDGAVGSRLAAASALPSTSPAAPDS
jgi:hypothetical protein